MSTTATANPSFVPQSPSHWVPDDKRSSCKTCHKEFTFFNRRHHCRSCREVFCSDCTDFRLLTRDPKDPTVVTSVRACRPCFDKFRGRKIRGQKANSGMAAASPAISHVRRNSKSEPQPPPQHTAQHKSVVEMPPHEYEGEDPTITGHETIRHEEDEDHYVYPDAEPQSVTLVLGLASDVSHVDRYVVMAAQGSVVLPSKSVESGLQFVDVDMSSSRLPAAAVDTATYSVSDKEQTFRQPVGGEKDEFDRSVSAVEGSEEILHIPSDSLASVKHANFALSDGRSVSAVEGGDEILHIPADALASVKHAHPMTSQQQLVTDEDGDRPWSERNVENRFSSPSPTTAVPMLFNMVSPTGEQQVEHQLQQQREEQSKLHVVV